MDLSAIQAKPISVSIKHPGTGQPTGLVLRIMSGADPAAGAARARFHAAIRIKTDNTDSSEAIEFAAALVVGWEWRGESNWKGEKLEFSLANVRTVLAGMHPLVRQQIDDEMADVSAFFRE